MTDLLIVNFYGPNFNLANWLQHKIKIFHLFETLTALLNNETFYRHFAVTLLSKLQQSCIPYHSDSISKKM